MRSENLPCVIAVVATAMCAQLGVGNRFAFSSALLTAIGTSSSMPFLVELPSLTNRPTTTCPAS